MRVALPMTHSAIRLSISAERCLWAASSDSYCRHCTQMLHDGRAQSVIHCRSLGELLWTPSIIFSTDPSTWCVQLGWADKGSCKPSQHPQGVQSAAPQAGTEIHSKQLPHLGGHSIMTRFDHTPGWAGGPAGSCAPGQGRSLG